MEIKKIYSTKDGKELEVGYENGKYMWFNNMNYFYIESLYSSGYVKTEHMAKEIIKYGKQPIYKFDTDCVYIELGNKVFKEWTENNEFQFCQIK